MGSRTSALAVAALLFAAPTAATAAPSAAERETARHLMDDGKARTKAGEFGRALDAYVKAHEIMHVPTTGMAVARTHYQMGHLVEARDFANEVIRMPKEPGEPPVFETARKQARELEAALKARIPTVKIHVRGATPIKVTVDDRDIPLAQLDEPIAMNPGSRVIVARGPDGAEARTQLALSEKDAKEIELELVPGTAATTDQAKETSRKVTGPSLESDLAPGQRSSTATAMIFGGFGLAVTGAVVGGITGGLAFSKADTVKPQCENGICDPAAESDLDSAKTLAMISNISFAAAGVGAVVGIIGLAMPKAHGVATGFYVTPGGAGVRGSF